MYQTFDPPAAGARAADRLRDLRVRLARLGLDGFFVPRADEHQGEYVAPASERLRWLTGFSGSAGWAAVTAKRAAVFVDGRYTVQAHAQVDAGCFEIVDMAQTKLGDWLLSALPTGAKFGFDPWLLTAGNHAALTEAVAGKALRLVAVAKNPLDRVWGRERPAPPTGAIIPHPLDLAGQSAADKIAGVQTRLKADAQDAVVLTQPDSIAWLLNIRGADVAHNPVALAFAIVPERGKPTLFVDPAKIGGNVRGHIEAVAKLAKPDAFAAHIAALKTAGRRVRVDPNSAAWAIKRALGPKAFKAGEDPCLKPKAIKNPAEIAGARAAHVRDGIAMTRFLAWLETAAATGRLDEIAAVRQLEAFRADTGALKEIAFDTISGSGPNGAIVHYRVTTASNRVLKAGELFLVDSGAQYSDGTTDITRTLAIGRPSLEMRHRFTLVLAGHIAVARARFPKCTSGAQIDAFASHALWQAGFDFDHGTGHGVGSYLCVHEGPQSISKKGMAGFEAGMIVSNEPGYYKAGQYGIRIENLLLVTEAATPKGGDRAMLGFETLTLAPIDRALIVPDMLAREDRAWLDAYHARVRAELDAGLDRETRAWLARATAAL